MIVVVQLGIPGTLLTYHLEKRHPELFTAFKEKQRISEQSTESSSLNPSESRQKKILQFTQTSNPLPRNSKLHKKLVCALTEFVCLDMQPVSVVEGIGFRKLLYTLEPRFQVPSRNHLSRTEIPLRYNQEAKSLKSQLLNPTSFSITTEIWSTSHQNCSYLSLTCHFVSRDFKFNSKCLETVEVPGGHDAGSLATVIQGLIDGRLGKGYCLLPLIMEAI